MSGGMRQDGGQGRGIAQSARERSGGRLGRPLATLALVLTQGGRHALDF